MPSKRLTVTQPFLPPLEEFIPLLEEIWESKTVTNNGPFHIKLEEELSRYLEVPQVNLLANGTLALVVALQALGVTGEVITTPYSFVATSNALLWNKLTPVFVDVELETCNINPALIEAAITEKTSAILAVHTYGNPCNTAEIQRIADRNGLKVIYDAAHAFGVRSSQKSVLNAGDMSTVSFHATKVFHTFEGGAVVQSSSQGKTQIDFLKNFGFADEISVLAPGINAKMSEVCAAMGLLQLRYVEDCLTQRLLIADHYRRCLVGQKHVRILELNSEVSWNGAYFPIFLEGFSRSQRDAVYEKLKSCEVLSRRYFFPLISELPFYQSFPTAEPSNLRCAHQLADTVLCLPIYPSMKDEDVERVVSTLRTALKTHS